MLWNTKKTSMKYGEKTNFVYKWGNNFKDNILHFFFQLIRDCDLIDLEHQLYRMLCWGKEKSREYRKELIILYKMIGHTRDIREGRGECQLAYMQLWVWYAYDPDLAFFAFTQFVEGSKYGSWKDIKKFCEYVLYKAKDEDHPLIKHACDLIVNQLKHDIIQVDKKQPISLAAKWAPREKTQYKWLFTKIAIQLYPQFIKTAKTEESKYYAICKSKIHLRKKLSQMNQYLKTTEHTMCNDTWKNIAFKNVPSKALCKYKLAFQNKKKDGKIRSNKIGRYICGGQFQYYIETTPIKHRKSTLNVGELVKYALHCTTVLDKRIINQLWEVDRKKNTHLENIIPIIDLSSSMERNNKEPLYNALGLGIRISEISWGAFKNRLIVFSATPTWVIFNETQSFVDKVIYVNNILRGLNSNIKSVFKMLIESFIATKFPLESIQNITLGIFSDMQHDEFSKYNPFSLHENIKKIFLKSSIVQLPKILFWNVRKTTGFPAMTHRKDIFLLSGSNAKMLNILTPYEKTINKVENKKYSNPYSAILKFLNNKRYNILNNKIISKI
jgi:hypothetical protein